MTDDALLKLWNGPTSQSNREKVLRFGRAILAHRARRTEAPRAGMRTGILLLAILLSGCAEMQASIAHCEALGLNWIATIEVECRP